MSSETEKTDPIEAFKKLWPDVKLFPAQEAPIREMWTKDEIVTPYDLRFNLPTWLHS